MGSIGGMGLVYHGCSPLCEEGHTVFVFAEEGFFDAGWPGTRNYLEVS